MSTTGVLCEEGMHLPTLNMAFVHGDTPALAVASASATFCTCLMSAVWTLLRLVWLV